MAVKALSIENKKVNKTHILKSNSNLDYTAGEELYEFKEFEELVQIFINDACTYQVEHWYSRNGWFIQSVINELVITINPYRKELIVRHIELKKEVNEVKVLTLLEKHAKENGLHKIVIESGTSEKSMYFAKSHGFVELESTCKKFELLLSDFNISV